MSSQYLSFLLYIYPLMLLFTHKLDTCCQAMCQEHRIAKNPDFRQRRITNRLDSVTVCTVGVNCNPLIIHMLLFTPMVLTVTFTSILQTAANYSLYGLYLFHSLPCFVDTVTLSIQISHNLIFFFPSNLLFSL